jgi:hypothetical protein
MKKIKRTKSLNVDRLGGALEKRYHLVFYSGTSDFYNTNCFNSFVNDGKKLMSKFKESRLSTLNRV